MILLSFPSFGLAAKTDLFDPGENPFSKSESPAIPVVFFEREGASLFPKCRISQEKYPGILPGFVKTVATVLYRIPFEFSGIYDSPLHHSRGRGNPVDGNPEISYKAGIAPVITRSYYESHSLDSPFRGNDDSRYINLPETGKSNRDKSDKILNEGISEAPFKNFRRPEDGLNLTAAPEGSRPRPFDAFRSAAAPYAGLKECDPDLSRDLTAGAARFELYPQLAFFPAVYGVAMGAGACGLGGFLGAIGGERLANEWEIGHRELRAEIFEEMEVEFLKHLPTEGEVYTALGPLAGGLLSGLTTYVAIQANSEIDPREGRHKFRKLLAKTASRLSGGIGVVCGTAGGAVGFLLGKVQTANQKTEAESSKRMEADQRASNLETVLSLATEENLKLQGNLDLMTDQSEKLQIALAEANLREEQAREEIKALEREIELSQETIRRTTGQKAELQIALAEANLREEQARKEIKALEQEIELSQKAVRLTGIEIELGKERLRLENLKFTLTDIRAEISDLKQALQRSGGLREELSGALQEAQGREKDIQETVSADSQRLQEAEMSLAAEWKELTERSSAIPEKN